jgi:hypothetical protein
MTPTHTNKQGARYRYYVSHAILQNRSADAGSVPRIPAAEVETAVVAALRERFATGHSGKDENVPGDRALVERHVEWIAVKRGSIELHLTETAHSQDRRNRQDLNGLNTDNSFAATIIIPWPTVAHAEVKGILHSPSQGTLVVSANRDGLLLAIAKARIWINHLLDGRVASFAEIAQRGASHPSLGAAGVCFAKDYCGNLRGYRVS